MSYMTFTCENRSPWDQSLTSKVTLETNSETLTDILAEFEQFLRGAGFHFDGQIDIVEQVDYDEINSTLEQLAQTETEQRIYESPDKGETVFSRSFGSTNRTQVR
jgi:hypothetical protein